MIPRLYGRNTYGLLACAAVCGLMAAPALARAQDTGGEPAAAAPDQAPDQALDINEFDVSGNTLLPAIDVQAAVYPYEGPGKRLSDVEKARVALQSAYADKGYQAVTVLVPQQKVQGGVVLLQVVETKTGTVTVAGVAPGKAKDITKHLPELATGQSPNFKALDTQLGALNARSADLQVTPQLKAGATPDTLDVELDVKQKLPLHWGLEVNNNYNQDTHHLRVQGNVEYDDLWHLGHSVSAFYQTAPGHSKDSEVYALTYSLPVTDGFRLAATLLHSGSNVSTVGSTTVIGKGNALTLNGYVGLPNWGAASQQLTLSLAAKDFKDLTLLQGVLQPTPITYYPLAATWATSLRVGKNAFTTSLNATVGLRPLGSDALAFDNKRFFSRGDFAYVRPAVTWTRTFAGNHQLYAAVDAQIANGPLISNEQFSIGGNGSVRGYLQGTAMGDSGVHGTAEVRSDPWAIKIDPKNVWLTSLRGLFFYDYGYATIIDHLPQQERAFRMSSTGIGVRSTLFNDYHFDADIAWPLRDEAKVKAGHPQFQFRLYLNR